MTPTLAVATYAALVGTAALGWQVFTWRRNQRTRITVRHFERAYYGRDGDEAGWAFIVKVVNRSGHDVSIAEVAAKDSGSEDYLPIPVAPPWDKLPFTLRQHHQVELGCDVVELESLDIRAAIVRLRLGDDSLHFSRPPR